MRDSGPTLPVAVIYHDELFAPRRPHIDTAARLIAKRRHEAGLILLLGVEEWQALSGLLRRRLVIRLHRTRALMPHRASRR